MLCIKVVHYFECIYVFDCLFYLLKCSGKKGRGEFKCIGWDEVFDEIVVWLRFVVEENLEIILFCSYVGTMGMV